MYSSRLRVFTQLALVAVLLFMVAAVPAAFADSRAEGGPVSQDGLPGQAAKPAAAAGPSREMGLDATNIVYDAIPALLPPSMASLGFQATQTFEFGDWVQLAGTNRALRTVKVTMVTWADYAPYAANPSYKPGVVVTSDHAQHLQLRSGRTAQHEGHAARHGDADGHDPVAPGSGSHVPDSHGVEVRSHPLLQRLCLQHHARHE